MKNKVLFFVAVSLIGIAMVIFFGGQFYPVEYDNLFGWDKFFHALFFSAAGFLGRRKSLAWGTFNVLWEVKDGLLMESLWGEIGSAGFSVPDLMISFLFLEAGIRLAKLGERVF